MHVCEAEGCDGEAESPNPYANRTWHKGFYSITMGFRPRKVVCEHHFPNVLLTGFECLDYPVLRPTSWIHICDECWSRNDAS